MICLSCRKKLPLRANFCDNCGTPTNRGVPYIRTLPDGRFLRVDDRGVLFVTLDHTAKKRLRKEAKLSPLVGLLPTVYQSRLMLAVHTLAEASPDILANMTGGKFIPEADIVTVRILYYPGNPDYDRLIPRNYLSVLTPHGETNIDLAIDRRMELSDYQPFLHFFPDKNRGMVLLTAPLNDPWR